MTTDKQKQYQSKWIARRKGDGWRHLTVFVPSQLVGLLKEQIRQWKFHNPSHYTNH